MKSVLDSVVKAVNFIHGRAMHSQLLFKALFEDLGKENQYLLFHTEVQHSSQGKLPSCVAELVAEVGCSFVGTGCSVTNRGQGGQPPPWQVKCKNRAPLVDILIFSIL